MKYYVSTRSSFECYEKINIDTDLLPNFGALLRNWFRLLLLWNDQGLK